MKPVRSAKRQKIEDDEKPELEDDAMVSLMTDLPLLTQEIDLEASKNRSNLTYHGKSVLLGHLTIDHAKRGKFLALSSKPVPRTKWVKEELAKKFAGNTESFYDNSDKIITIKVNDELPDWDFRMSMTAPFKELFRAYERRPVVQESYNNNPMWYFFPSKKDIIVRDSDTPESLGLKDGDVLVPEG